MASIVLPGPRPCHDHIARGSTLVSIARTYREVRECDDTGPDAATLARLDELRTRHDQTRKSIRAVLNVGDQNEGFMAEELTRLNEELKTLANAIGELEAQPTRAEPMELNSVAEALRAIDPVWDVLLAEEQQRIVQLLVENITISTSGIDIRFRTNGIEQIVDELQPREGHHIEDHA
ncbi:MAG: hypothetical protein GY842_25570 [bacterium]|nr:hypothetical protein [bacterium]